MMAASGRVGTSQTRNSSVPNVGCGRTSHQIFLASSMQCRSIEQLDVVLVLAPRAEVIGHAGAREAAEDRRAVRLQAGVAPHPERRAGRQREQVRQEVARLVHQVDRRRPSGHGDVDVQAEDQQRPRQLLQLLDDAVVADAGRENLILPVRKRMRAGGRDRQPDALGGAGQLAADAEDLVAQLGDVAADLRATSTIDWCSSRLIWSPSAGALEASSSETCERSSHVCGSTIWNSSSTPTVNRWDMRGSYSLAVSGFRL